MTQITNEQHTAIINMIMKKHGVMFRSSAEAMLNKVRDMTPCQAKPLHRQIKVHIWRLHRHHIKA